MDNNNKIILAALLGAAAGAVVGLLLAPNIGDEAMEEIKEKAKGLKDELSDSVDKLAKKGIEQLDELSQDLADKTEEL